MNNPFDNLSNSQIKKLYILLDVHIYKYNKDQELVPTIRKGNIIGIILNGYAQMFTRF